MNMSKRIFGQHPQGGTANLYTLENDSGMRVSISDLGGIVTSLLVPDRNGKLDDVVLGYATMEDYLRDTAFLGAAIGRNANRIGGAAVDILSSTCFLEKNDGENNLHSGSNGLHRRLLSAELSTVAGNPALVLNTVIQDMSDGLPGNLSLTITYYLTDDNALTIDYRASADQNTIINLTNHSYFNLAGHASGTVCGHIMQLHAAYYTPAGADGIPTGEIRSVQGTPFDFRGAKAIGEDINANCEQLRQFGGYDHNYVLVGSGYRPVGVVSEPVSGRCMEVFTDLPGIQFYTGNGLPSKDCKPKDGAAYAKYQGFCLETQTFPDAAAMPWVVSPIYLQGEEYHSTTTYQFVCQ